MTRQYVVHGMPAPVYVNETGTRQSIVGGSLVNETGAAIFAYMYPIVFLAR